MLTYFALSGLASSPEGAKYVSDGYRPSKCVAMGIAHRNMLAMGIAHRNVWRWVSPIEMCGDGHRTIDMSGDGYRTIDMGDHGYRTINSGRHRTINTPRTFHPSPFGKFAFVCLALQGSNVPWYV